MFNSDRDASLYLFCHTSTLLRKNCGRPILRFLRIKLTWLLVVRWWRVTYRLSAIHEFGAGMIINVSNVIMLMKRDQRRHDDDANQIVPSGWQSTMSLRCCWGGDYGVFVNVTWRDLDQSRAGILRWGITMQLSVHSSSKLTRREQIVWWIIRLRFVTCRCVFLHEHDPDNAVHVPGSRHYTDAHSRRSQKQDSALAETGQLFLQFTTTPPQP